MNMYPPTSPKARACHSLSLSLSKGERGRGCGAYRNKTECQQMCWDPTRAWAKWGGNPNGVAILTGPSGRTFHLGFVHVSGRAIHRAIIGILIAPGRVDRLNVNLGDASPDSCYAQGADFQMDTIFPDRKFQIGLTIISRRTMAIGFLSGIGRIWARWISTGQISIMILVFVQIIDTAMQTF